ncbi:MAG: hypothetical protein AMXMBFR36_17330 [Acidobacteriota bacterium]
MTRLARPERRGADSGRTHGRFFLPRLAIALAGWVLASCGDAGRVPGAPSRPGDTRVASAPDPQEAARLVQRLDARTEGARAPSVFRGATGWLFLPAENQLRRARRAADLTRPAAPGGDPATASDPLGAIRDFDRQLRSRGIALLFVPVPTKLAVYPELLADLPLADGVPRLDPAVVDLFRTLESEGIATLDLWDEFVARRQPESDPLYLATDTHWSPRGAELAARTVAERLRRLGFAPRPGPQPCAVAQRPEQRVQITGDLARFDRTSAEPPGETVLLRPVERPSREAASSGPREILVLGDSHLAIWRDPPSGFVDHLELELCRPVDEVSVQAGGATASRQRLSRQPELLAGKRIVVWVISSRLLVSGPPWLPVAISPK